MNEMKKCIFDEVHENIQKSQTKQKSDNDVFALFVTFVTR